MNTRKIKSDVVVVKVGTSTLTYQTSKLNLKRLDILSRVISDLKNSGKKVVLVSSGAIGVGMSKLGMSKRPESIKEKQAVAAVGQCELMSIYDRLFAEYGTIVAQILLTKDVLVNKERNENVVNTFDTLLGKGIIPIVNENDSISVDEIKFGDNDTLSAIVANLVKADTLIILSDIDGLYDKNPREHKDAIIISTVNKIDENIENMASGAGTKVGTGGMITKINAAKMATENNIDVIIANGNDPHIIYDILDGAELYKVTKDGDEVLLAIYDSKRPNPAHPDVEGCFVRLEDINR